ncbi:2-keto-4-pentenoate hydratase [Pollutimonas harenae]|uniref:Hydratase n=1 Tax=Pollutimonas harenae TaxID=657015 RepID=A0A853H294_9BURK|nr:hydratase [Pollutimonas harenae]NYT84693.1 hydratase [Pollutimonas harenae]TEA72904.1 hydratase [Pollutimonas harenae]
MQESEVARQAAASLSAHWRNGKHLEQLPMGLRPRNRKEGYAIQSWWTHELGQDIAGWKIAATSAAGQRHIGVSGPLAGPVFAGKMLSDGAGISLAGNRMCVAEGEFVFMMGQTLPFQSKPYTREEVLAAVSAIHPGIEIPNSRFLNFEDAGEAQLIADCACSHQMVLGAAATDIGAIDGLINLPVQASVNDGRQFTGSGANVLGDPIIALCWLANELRENQLALKQGQFVTTGSCVAPIPVAPGQRVSMDFGWVGSISASFIE